MPLYNHSLASPLLQATTDLLSSLQINLHSKELYVMKLYHVDPFSFCFLLFFFFGWLTYFFITSSLSTIILRFIHIVMCIN